jgi:arsenate reductase-like glutaredoxin family protein
MTIDPPKPIKLYSNKSCPWAQRARIALLEAGVKYEEIEIDLQNKPGYFWKINPVISLLGCWLIISKEKFLPWNLEKISSWSQMSFQR